MLDEYSVLQSLNDLRTSGVINFEINVIKGSSQVSGKIYTHSGHLIKSVTCNEFNQVESKRSVGMELYKAYLKYKNKDIIPNKNEIYIKQNNELNFNDLITNETNDDIFDFPPYIERILSILHSNGCLAMNFEDIKKKYYSKFTNGTEEYTQHNKQILNHLNTLDEKDSNIIKFRENNVDYWMCGKKSTPNLFFRQLDSLMAEFNSEDSYEEYINKDYRSKSSIFGITITEHHLNNTKKCHLTIVNNEKIPKISVEMMNDEEDEELEQKLILKLFKEILKTKLIVSQYLREKIIQFVLYHYHK